MLFQTKRRNPSIGGVHIHACARATWFWDQGGRDRPRTLNATGNVSGSSVIGQTRIFGRLQGTRASGWDITAAVDETTTHPLDQSTRVKTIQEGAARRKHQARCHLEPDGTWSKEREGHSEGYDLDCRECKRTFKLTSHVRNSGPLLPKARGGQAHARTESKHKCKWIRS